VSNQYENNGEVSSVSKCGPSAGWACSERYKTRGRMGVRMEKRLVVAMMR
jgi:hypothetical protein